MSPNASSNISNEEQWNMKFHTPLVILAFIILIVNIPVVVLYFKISSLRHSAGNTFLVGLAFADILCACVMIPTGIICELEVLEREQHITLCAFHFASNLTISVASIYHILAATAAKYFAIVHPMRNITACTNMRVNIIAALIWISSFLVGHIPFWLPHLESNQFSKVVHEHAIFLIVYAFAIPMFILTCIHVHIYVRLFINSRPRALMNEANARVKNNRRIAIVFSLLFVFFIVSWLPWYLLWAGFITIDVEHKVGLLRFIAPIINPLMFTFAKRDFRKAATSLGSRLRGKQPEFSSRRYFTQATSSIDRTNFIEQQKVEVTSKAPEPELQAI